MKFRIGYLRDMDQPTRDDQCIERRVAYTPLNWFYSVSEYEDQLALAELWSTADERRRHDLEWTEVAPPVEKLSTGEFVYFGRDGFRISDWDVYDSQMRELIGLD
jgi:hypothetical protein